MSEQPDQPDDIMQLLTGGMSQLRAAMDEAMAPPRFEYAQVPWIQVNELALQGWQLVPIPASYTAAEPVYVMQRTLGVADEAAGLLKRGSNGGR